MAAQTCDSVTLNEELTLASCWWRSLSINQMKALEAKHNQNTFHFSWRNVREIWLAEGRPLPE